MNDKKWKKRIEESLRFELSNTDVVFINDQFNWLETSLKVISDKKYKETKSTSLPNIEITPKEIKDKEVRNISKKVILDNAGSNTSEDNFITYPRK